MLSKSRLPAQFSEEKGFLEEPLAFPAFQTGCEIERLKNTQDGLNSGQAVNLLFQEECMQAMGTSAAAML